MFLIYINDLHKSIHYSRTYHFADDTHLPNVSESAKRIQKHINIDLKCLYKWLLANKISLNRSKTELIIFHSNRNEDTFKFRIKINGHTIQPTTNIKYLGVILDNDLSGKHHCKMLESKLNRANGMLSKVRHYVPHNELKSIYHAIYSSHLSYNCQVWGQSGNPRVAKIGKLQNKAMRIINFKEYNAPSKPLYAECKILKLDDLVKLNNCLFIYDYINGLLPNCFEDYFIKMNVMYENFETRNSSMGALFVPSVNTTKYGLNSIAYKSIQCWNYIINLCKNDLSKLSRCRVKKNITSIFTAQMLLS